MEDIWNYIFYLYAKLCVGKIFKNNTLKGIFLDQEFSKTVLWNNFTRTGFILKGSYYAISSFPFSLECYLAGLCIDKIPEVAKIKVSKPRYSL